MFEMDLPDTAVTDTGLTHLQKVSALRILCLDGTCVTAKGIAQLHGVLPNCVIRKTK